MAIANPNNGHCATGRFESKRPIAICRSTCRPLIDYDNRFQTGEPNTPMRRLFWLPDIQTSRSSYVAVSVFIVAGPAAL